MRVSVRLLASLPLWLVPGGGNYGVPAGDMICRPYIIRREAIYQGTHTQQTPQGRFIKSPAPTNRCAPAGSNLLDTGTGCGERHRADTCVATVVAGSRRGRHDMSPLQPNPPRPATWCARGRHDMSPLQHPSRGDLSRHPRPTNAVGAIYQIARPHKHGKAIYQIARPGFKTISQNNFSNPPNSPLPLTAAPAMPAGAGCGPAPAPERPAPGKASNTCTGPGHPRASRPRPGPPCGTVAPSRTAAAG